MSDVTMIEKLHQTLRLRETPETVAELVRKALTPRELQVVDKPLKHVINASVRRHYGWSSMATRFREPVGAERQLAKARELALLFLNAQLPAAEDPDAVEAVAADLGKLIGRPSGASNFKSDRLNRQARAALPLQLSRRRYDKLFRLASRLEDKARRLRAEQERFELTLFSKAALAPRLTLEDLGGHTPTAAFLAYYAARLKLRSVFTASGQQKPFDELSASLLVLCERDPETRWFAVAHIFPREDILARLSDEQRGQILAQAFNVLQLVAERLDQLQRVTAIDVETMVVRRGNDSTNWNMLAGAWNRARDHWIAIVEAMRMQKLFDLLLPGKVMRLMAADVAAWHRSIGQALHPDTLIWNALPYPWLVLRGDADCGRADIEAACKRFGVDPIKSGWTSARPRRLVSAFRPTPELVHGVAVSNPYLADYLRRLGAFSGKKIKPLNVPT